MEKRVLRDVHSIHPTSCRKHHDLERFARDLGCHRYQKRCQSYGRSEPRDLHSAFAAAIPVISHQRLLPFAFDAGPPRASIDLSPSLTLPKQYDVSAPDAVDGHAAGDSRLEQDFKLGVTLDRHAALGPLRNDAIGDFLARGYVPPVASWIQRLLPRDKRLSAVGRGR
ncbi:hypothetical protein LAC79_32305 [Ensifer adhaerens]|uniref:hypothetical protein n=1 Tax=Ensifer adhaerens TaxID=106592 RepID=UPI001CBE3E02|nr:hypothetical protein [Ensifer adhaerens]MBZ7926458.1 hypothetical protein [Ensifer adhaerens]UAX97194.1 hypothetical protein LAC78_26020 [Ensifer adhaerens]